MFKKLNYSIVEVIKISFLSHLNFLFCLALISFPKLIAAQSANPELRSQFEDSFKEVPYKVDLKKKIGLLVRNQNKDQENGGSKRLLSDLTKASFLKLSNYQSTVIDLSELENIWEKSIEFNDADFEKLFDAAKFDVFAIVDYEPVKKGINFSINFYNTENENQGAIIYSIPSQLLEIDWSSIEEVEILSAGEAKALNESIELILQQQEIVQDPKTFEEHFANYQIHETDGKSLDSITSLISAIILKPDFVDLITDVTRLTRSYFGGEASEYLETALYPYLHPQLIDFSKLLLDPNYDIFSSCNLDTARLSQCEISVDKIIFPQLLNLFVNTQGERYAADKKSWGVNEVREYVLLQATRSVLEAYKDGSISDNYFNKLRSIADVNQSLLFDLEQKLNTASFIPIKIKNYILGSGNSINIPNFKSSVNNGKLTHQFLPIENSYENLAGNRNETSAPPLEFYNFSTNSFEGGETNTASRNIREVLNYLPPKFMSGGARDVLDFMDHRTLGPCGFSNGRHSRLHGKYKTYATYFSSVEERSDFIKYIFSSDISKELRFPSEIRNEAISYWKSLPTLDLLVDDSIPGLFRAPYLASSNNYLPQNSDPDGGEAKLHGDKFLTPENDRLIWADVCIVNMMRAIANRRLRNAEYVELRYTNDGLPVFDFNALASLYITDSVDTSKPIYVSSSNDTGNSVEWARLDISSDGTYFDPNGLNLDVTQFVRFVGFNVLHENNWLFAPGIVQSSIGLNDIDEIKYTDIYGNDKTVKPTKSHSRSAWAQMGTTVIDRTDEYLRNLANLKTPKEYFFNYSDLNYSLFEAMEINLSGSLLPQDSSAETVQNHPKPIWCSKAQSEVEKTICSNANLSQQDLQLNELYENFRSNKIVKSMVRGYYKRRMECGSNIECIQNNYNQALTFLTRRKENNSVLNCGLPNASALITNVETFTNLRQEAGLNGKTIGQVPLGASVSVVNPGNYLRYDRCAAACSGTNQNEIKACIDNNDVWIEVLYNGRRGFLSRKFLE